MANYILEACVDSVESALAADRGGADRVELCANLIIGGTTSGTILFEEIRKHSDITVNVLIRPRSGDFCYSDYEFEVIKGEVMAFRQLGADGIVIGILRPDGTLNMDQMKILMDLAGNMPVTLHRAFDVCKDPFEALEQAVDLGIKTILTSGQKHICTEGAELIKQLVKQSDGRIDIQVGGGVNAEVIRRLHQTTGAAVYHMSGKRSLDSQMIYRKADVSMGVPSIGEYEIWRTDETAIQAARQVLEECFLVDSGD